MADYLAKNTPYPKDAKEYGIEGTVYLSFWIMKDGTITNVRIKNSLFPSLDSVAFVAVTNMPKWKPAMQNGSKVNLNKSIPIKFSLNGKTKTVKPWVKVTPANNKKVAQPCGEGAKGLIPYQKANARPIQAQIWDAITPYDVPMDGIDTLEVLMTLDQAGTVTEAILATEGKGSNSRISNKTKTQIVEAFKALVPFTPASCNGKAVETTLRYYVILERAKPTTPPRTK
jgi:TonB family protein